MPVLGHEGGDDSEMWTHYLKPPCLLQSLAFGSDGHKMPLADCGWETKALASS